MKTKNTTQSVTFNATPHEVYQTLMDSKKHAAFTGGKATISTKIGGTFKVYDGYIKGMNLDLVPDKKIVQAWRGSDWPKHHFSVVTFRLIRVKAGTELIFTQIGIPDDLFKDILSGWKEYYWEPMKEAFEKNKL
ncbi:MAG: SRPBCC family protein [Patescibacteria group bacterium]